MQELTHRDRNLRFVEHMFLVNMLERILYKVDDLVMEVIKTNPNLKLEPEKVAIHRKKMRTDIEELSQQYEAEVFQDAYLPEFQRQMQEALRRKRRLEAEQKDLEKARLDEINSMTEED